MSRRALLWSIAAAVVAFFYLAASYAGPGECTTLNFTQWGKSYFLTTGYWGNYSCEVLPRVAVLLVGLVASLVLVYFAEKGQGHSRERLSGATAGRLRGTHEVQRDSDDGTFFCIEEGCDFSTADSGQAKWHGTFGGSDAAAGRPTGTPTLNTTTYVGERRTSPPAREPSKVRQLDDSTSSPAPDFKTCPDCAEEVRSAARKCRFCGYEFAPAAASGLGA